MQNDGRLGTETRSFCLAKNAASPFTQMHCPRHAQGPDFATLCRHDNLECSHSEKDSILAALRAEHSALRARHVELENAQAVSEGKLASVGAEHSELQVQPSLTSRGHATV